MRNEEDLTSRARDYESAQIAFGFVGWPEREEHVDKGNPSGRAGERHTLVYVTLGGLNAQPGANELRPQNQGRRILCALSSLVGARIPKKGTRVLVATPPGMEESPGASVIIATIEDDQRTNLADDDVIIPARQGAAKVVVKSDGSLALFTTADNTDSGQSVYLRCAKDGFSFVAPWGTVKFDATGFHILHSSGASFDLGGIYGLPSPLDQITSYVRMSAATINGRASAVSFGTGTPDPLAKVTALEAAISALQTEVAAVAAALNAVAAIAPLLPAHVTAAGAATTAVSTAATALAAATALLPASTSSL